MKSQEASLILKIEQTANLEKAAKAQQDRGLHLYNANLKTDEKLRFLLQSNKEHATSIHVDVRGAATQQTNRLNKRITILETKRFKLRTDESHQKINNKSTVNEINELRLTKQSLDQIFDTIKSEIEEVTNNIAEQFMIANATYEKRIATMRTIADLKAQEIVEKNQHQNNIYKYDNIVLQTIANAKANEKRVHQNMLKEKKERKLAKQRLNNTFSRNKANSGDYEKKNDAGSSEAFTRGTLSDDQEKSIRRSIAHLEAEVKAAAAASVAALGDSGSRKEDEAGKMFYHPLHPSASSLHHQTSKEKMLATLHTLRIARQQLLLSSRQAQQHTERKIQNISNDELNIIMNDKNTVINIIKAWKSNEKYIFDLVQEIQKMNNSIRAGTNDIKVLKTKTTGLKSFNSEEDVIERETRKTKKRELMEISNKNSELIKKTGNLKNEIDQMCQTVEAMLESTNMKATQKNSKEPAVRPFTLLKMSGVLEDRAINIINAYRVWEEMTNDEAYMTAAKYSTSFLPPLPSHKKFKQKFGPKFAKSLKMKKQRSRGSKRSIVDNGRHTVDPPTLSNCSSFETRPLTLKETRLLMSM